MKWSIYVGRVSGIKIFIHWTFFILIFWIILSGATKGSSVTEILWSLGFICAIFFCIVLHELGHALTAKRFNFKTRDITLLPIGGLARMETLPDKPMQEFLVALMGPAVNGVISLVLLVILLITNSFPHSIAELNVVKMTTPFFLFELFAANIFLALFNLIPAFPMDGGRILRAILSSKLPRARATRIAATVGQFIAIIFVLVGIFYNPVLALIGVFVFLGARAEANMEETKAILDHIHVKDLIMHTYTVLHPDEPLSRAVDLLLNGQEKSFLVQTDGEIKGVLSKKDIINGLSRFGKNIPIQKVMQTKVVSLHESDSIANVIAKYSDGETTLMPVVEGKKITGVVNIENINEFIQVQNALEAAHQNRK